MSRTDSTRRCELCGREVGTEYYVSGIGWFCGEHYPRISVYQQMTPFELGSLIGQLVGEKNTQIAKLEARVKELETALARVIQELKEEIIYSAALEGPTTDHLQKKRDAEVAERFAELDKLKSGSKDKE